MSENVVIQLWRSDALSADGKSPAIQARSVGQFGQSGIEHRYPLKETLSVDGIKVELTLRVLDA